MLGRKIVSTFFQKLNTRVGNSLIRSVAPTISTSNVLFPHNNVNSCFRNTFLLHKDYSTSAIESVKELPHDSAIDNVNHLLKNYEEGRLFAIVHICGKQFRVVEGDIIVIEGYWPPDIGDKISLDKILLAGSADFSLIGRPLVKKDLVKVTATIIEKTLSHTKTVFKKKRRKQFMRINFQRFQHTMLRINSIEIQEQINSRKEEPNEINIY